GAAQGGPPPPAGAPARGPPQRRQRLEPLGGGCARIRVQLENRGVELRLRPPRQVASGERSDERRALPDLLERGGIEHSELLLDTQRQRRRPLAEPRLRDHYCARTPWTGPPGRPHA